MTTAYHSQFTPTQTRMDGDKRSPLRWFRSRGGASWPVALDERVRQVGGSLHVRSALLEDSGRYVCLVNNSVGAERASTSLLVTTPLSAYMVPQQQTVDVGRPAQLNCSTEGHPQLAFSWLKDGRPIHTSSRVRLVSPQTLKIDHVERTDRGMYQCFVSNNDETAQGTAEIKLGDAAPVLVATWQQAALRPGAPWSAECEAAGSPLPALSWFRDGAPLTSEEHRVQVSVQAGSASVRGRLSLAAVRPEDGGAYECVASNAVGAASHAAALHVLGPPHVRPMPDRRVVAHTDAAFHCRVTGYPISEIRWEKEEAPEIEPIAVKSDLQQGMRMHLTCVVRKGDLPISIHWMKDGSAIAQDQDMSAKPYDEYSNILSFTSLAVRHTGNYTCQAANSAAITNYTVEIIVNDPPSWRVQPDDTETVAGKSVVLPCAAEGSPSPRIMWKKNTGPVPPLYKELSHLMENYKIMQNGSLVVYNTRPEDSGYYMCQASNGVGVALSKVIYLTVHGEYLHDV
ncbi:Down syndrome cell adhesion molecule-like protein Dscam2 [Schistocerca americana]|uniref:Down syndrome cell adhesion molecule-like protein Dscam2 n=1 Tax=Schistocerca americana TaxID=7009 RepID=UPI001F4F89A3|nr:Down syndrome cell adhesion molecule-like protein Dscam2 [Schistocerca americana]